MMIDMPRALESALSPTPPPGEIETSSHRHNRSQHRAREEGEGRVRQGVCVCDVQKVQGLGKAGGYGMLCFHGASQFKHVFFRSFFFSSSSSEVPVHIC